MFRHSISAFCALLFIAIPAFANDTVGVGRMNFEFDFGKFTPGTSSQIYDDLHSSTDFSNDDFDSSAVQFKLLYQTNNSLQLGFGFSHFEQNQDVIDLDYSYPDGSDIQANVALTTNWVGFNGAWAPLGWGRGAVGTQDWKPRLFTPYLAFGGGLKSWSFNFKGDFVGDENGTPSIYEADVSEDGIAFVGKIGCGARINLHKNIDFNFLFEKEIGEDDLGTDFNDADLDLGGKAIYIGVVVRL